MIEIQDLIKPENIFLDLTGRNRFDVIHQIIQLMQPVDEIEDLAEFEAEVVRREKEIPTGLQMGAALPHARSKSIKKIVMAFARLKQGIDFGADGKEPARLVFLFGVPNDEINDYLKLVSKLCRMLRQEDFRQNLLSAKTPDEVIEILKNS